ncbi:hypothetical protein GCM10027341_35510 [Spirosoma knui]
MRTQRLIPLLIYSTTLLLIGCKKVKPDPPKAEGFDTPITPELSYVAGPISFELRALENKISQALDPVLLGDSSNLGDFKPLPELSVIRSGPVKLHYKAQQVSISAPIDLWLKSPFHLGKRKPPRLFCSLEVNFQSPLTVTPTWRLNTQVKLSDYQWVSRPKLRIIGKNIYLTGLVEKVLKKLQPSIETAIDSAVYKNLRLDKMVAPIWADLQKPLVLNKQYGLWLLPKPISIAAGPVYGDERMISIPLRMAFETRTELKPKMPEVAKTPLPLLQRRAQLPQTSELHVTSFIPFNDINRMLALTLNRQPVKLAKDLITLKKAEVYSGQRAVIVKAEVSGLVDGVIYLRGRPTFETKTNTLRVDQLVFDADTKNVLLGSDNELIQGALQHFLGELLTFPLGEEIHKLPQIIGQAYEKSGAGEKTDLDIRSFQFTPRRIAVLADGIQALIDVNSTIHVKVDRL